MALAGAGRKQEALAAYDAGVADALEHGDDRELMVLCMHRAPLLATLDRQEDAIADARRAAQIAEQAQDRYSRAVAHWITADILERRGEIEGALAERSAEVEILLSIGNPRNMAIAQAHRARLLARLGHLEQAAEAAEEAERALGQVDDPRLATEVRSDLAQLSERSRPGKSSGRVRL